MDRYNSLQKAIELIAEARMKFADQSLTSPIWEYLYRVSVHLERQLKAEFNTIIGKEELSGTATVGR